MPRTSTPATASGAAKGQSRTAPDQAGSAKSAGKDQAKDHKDGKTPAKTARAKTAGGAKGAEKAAPSAKPATKGRSDAAKSSSAPSPAAKASPSKASPSKASPSKTTAGKASPSKTSAAKAAPAAPRSAAPGRLSRPQAQASAGGESYAGDTEFLAQQRAALLEERETYVDQARQLRAEAESLVQEMEPGDVQFDEESGEGGTTTVDRERDLALSAQALAAVEEIDDALEKMDAGRYGVCEGCGQLILKARLEALPYARLCIACKSGGLSRR